MGIAPADQSMQLQLQAQRPRGALPSLAGWAKSPAVRISPALKVVRPSSG
jgi:hypothetical protein